MGHAAGTPNCCRPALIVAGSEWAKPTIISEKKVPIDSDIRRW
jgi:hypothetical protein